MKKLLPILALCIFANAKTMKAQDLDFTPGWYIVEKSATFSDGSFGETTEDKEAIYVGEVLFAYMKIEDVYYCVSLQKDDIYIKGTNSLTKIVSTGKVGILNETVSLMETDLQKGSSFWVVSLDAGTGQATILLNNGQKQNIPSKSIDIASKWMKVVTPLYTFNPVQ